MSILANELPVDGWRERIWTAWRSSVDGILECGRLLIEAKIAVEHGEFGNLIAEGLPFSAKTAIRLMKISRDQRLVNGAHGHLLPPSWRTLYEINKLSEDQFSTALEQGVIHPETERGDIAKFLREYDRVDYEAKIEDGCTVDELQTLINAGKKFGVIYADPPWEFKVYSGKGKARSADNHYETRGLDWIKSLPVAQLAADDCALFLWSVWPELPGAMEVMEAWGFKYKTIGFNWVKTVSLENNDLHWGMGYWTRANSEPCFLATKGSPTRLDKGVHQVIMSPVSEHSRKPDEASVRIERLLAGPYLELFARRPMRGWTVWGNEISRGLFHQDIPALESVA